MSSSSTSTALTAHNISSIQCVDAVMGAQFGDEGKGKIVDLISKDYSYVARCAGGANAGHTLVVNGVKFKFHLLPSGLLNLGTKCIVGNGVVLHVASMVRELTQLEANKISIDDRLIISKRAHIVFDFHMIADAANEKNLGDSKIGTTKKGIGPVTASKYSRTGCRVGELLSDPNHFKIQFTRLYESFKNQYPKLFAEDGEYPPSKMKAELEYHLTTGTKFLRKYVQDTVSLVNREIRAKKKFLVEGANATMLSIDVGTYPYVTSSNCEISGACTGLGMSPHFIGRVIGIVKAYMTRVGEGNFPTECLDESGSKPDAVGKHMLDVGFEYGTTTGRPRRCGWIDIVQLKYAIGINNFTVIALTKIDVLSGLNEIKVCTGYTNKLTGKPLLEFEYPSTLAELDQVIPTYITVDGWEEDISGIKDFAKLPANCRSYVELLETLMDVHIEWVSVGPDRISTIHRKKYF